VPAVRQLMKPTGLLGEVGIEPIQRSDEATPPSMKEPFDAGLARHARLLKRQQPGFPRRLAFSFSHRPCQNTPSSALWIQA
jgi:hypothetical protein